MGACASTPKDEKSRRAVGYGSLSRPRERARVRELPNTLFSMETQRTVPGRPPGCSKNLSAAFPLPAYLHTAIRPDQNGYRHLLGYGHHLILPFLIVVYDPLFEIRAHLHELTSRFYAGWSAIQSVHDEPISHLGLPFLYLLDSRVYVVPKSLCSFAGSFRVVFAAGGVYDPS